MPKTVPNRSLPNGEIMRGIDLLAPVFLSRRDLKRLGINVANVTLIRWENAGRFVKRVRLGGTRVAWPADQIKQWCQDRINERERFVYADP